MLQSLAIENFAIIEQATLDFADGMTVLSGETGAGKSIIIDALGILCGGRSSSEMIRQDCERLIVEGLFQFTESQPVLKEALSEFGIEFNSADDLIIRREITVQGKNLIRINGQLANVSLLKKIGTHLVDIHGQNEHQALLDNTQHLAMLDQFARSELSEIQVAYRTAYQQYQQLKKDWQQSQRSEQNELQQLSFLEFQLQEIEQAQLVEGEDEALETISKRLQNAQKIQQNIEAVNYVLSESETNALDQLKRASHFLKEIEEVHTPFVTLSQQLDQLYYELQEIAHQVAVSSGDFEEESQTIDEVEARLNQLGQLKRKYGMSISEIMGHYQTISEEVYRIQHREKYLETLEAELIQAYDTAYQLAQQLSVHRQQSAQTLVREIEHQLKDLYMANSRFEVKFKVADIDKTVGAILQGAVTLTPTGFDQVEFYVSTNAGETLKPLVKVASGGELSRFMLALKTVFSANEKAKTMVFDEIDTGVSGRVAQAIAEKMAQVSTKHQVLCITHLPQVAAIAHEQLYIEKIVIEGRTHTRVSALDLSRRSEVIAQMMSGKTVSETSLQLAEELLKELQS